MLQRSKTEEPTMKEFQTYDINPFVIDERVRELRAEALRYAAGEVRMWLRSAVASLRRRSHRAA